MTKATSRSENRITVMNNSKTESLRWSNFIFLHNSNWLSNHWKRRKNSSIFTLQKSV